MHSPLEQFKVNTLIPLEVFGYDISFTNSSLFMLLAITFAIILMGGAVMKKNAHPGRMQVFVEMIYEMIEDMLGGTVGSKGRIFLPLIFTLFLFILSCNLLGMIPYSFTVTSHIAVTFGIAILLFIFITVLGFIKHGFHYLSLFMPEGTPMIMAPLMILIELFAYLARPVSLSVRLAANMTAGHIVLKVLASFVIMAGAVGVLPFALLTVLQGFELFVAVLQAYVFAILTCAYLNDAVNLH